ncbi:MAG: efflux RND transporter periplasmic adaptor subunit [Cyanobacteria bacterium J06621_8]
MKERSLQSIPRNPSKAKPPFKFLGKYVQPQDLAKTGKLLIVSAVLLSAGFLVGRGHQATDTNSEAAAPIPTKKVNVLPVSTVKVEAVGSYQTAQSYTGSVTALRSSEVGFELRGKIVAIAVDEGDTVKAGQTIAQLDTITLEAQRQGLVAQKDQAQAVLAELKNGARTEQVASAQARVRDLQQQLELEKIRNSRREYLYQQGAIAQEQLDEVAFNRQALQERLQDAQGILAELENGTRIERVTAQQAAIDILIANIRELDIQIDKSTLKSPFDGVISSRNFDEGTVVEAGSSVVRLVESDRLEAKIGVPVTVIPAIAIDSQQEVLINGSQYSATVNSILPEIDPNTRTRTVILTLDPPASRQVSPGEMARITFTQTNDTDGYWLPITALVKEERGLWSCYGVVTDKGGERMTTDNPNSHRVERKLVEILETDGERVLVKGTLREGDVIIADGTQRLVPGQLVSY